MTPKVRARIANRYLSLPLTDVGNAERLVARYGHVVRYCPPFKKWYWWDGVRWTRDDRHRILALGKETARALYSEVELGESEADRRARSRHALTSERAERIRAMVAMAESEDIIIVLPEQFDRDPYLLNVNNGTVDLRTGRIRPHDPNDLMTKLAPVIYDPGEVCPRWEKVVARAMNHDAARIGFLQRAIGYTLTGTTDEQCLFLLIGTGANSKSTIIEVIRRLLGSYALKADFATFLQGAAQRAGSAPTPDLARLNGPRFVSASESGDGRRLDEALVCDLTGGEPLTARFLHAEPFEFMPQLKLWLSTNHKPVIRDSSDAIWRRLRIIEFPVVIPESERDPHLVHWLVEHELSGILNWCVAGCRMWQGERRLITPGAIRVATQAYREEYDALTAFFDECCELCEAHSESATALYETYRGWAIQRAEDVVSLTAFGRALTSRNIGTLRRATGVLRLGIRLRERPAQSPVNGSIHNERPEENSKDFSL